MKAILPVFEDKLMLMETRGLKHLWLPECESRRLSIKTSLCNGALGGVGGGNCLGFGIYIDDASFSRYRRVVQRLAQQGKLAVVFSDESLVSRAYLLVEYGDGLRDHVTLLFPKGVRI